MHIIIIIIIIIEWGRKKENQVHLKHAFQIKDKIVSKEFFSVGFLVEAINPVTNWLQYATMS